MSNFLARLREPSTWAGIAALVSLFGGTVAPEQAQAVVALGTAAAGAAAVFLPERKG